MGDPADFYARGLQQFGDIHGRGLSLDGGIRGDDDFNDIATSGSGTIYCIWKKSELGIHTYAAALYDGKEVSDLSRSAGYLLGDEGSAVALGRMFLADVMRSIAPRTIADDFMVKYKVLSNNDLRDLVYQHPDIEKLLVSVALFLKDYKKHSYVKALVLKNFKDFFVRCVMRYDDYKNLPFSAVGHMAYDFRAELKEVAKEYDVKVHAVEVKPMTGLVQYHLNHPEV